MFTKCIVQPMYTATYIPYGCTECNVLAGIYEAQHLLVSVTGSHQSCVDPTAVQENEIPSPSVASVTC